MCSIFPGPRKLSPVKNSCFSEKPGLKGGKHPLVALRVVAPERTPVLSTGGRLLLAGQEAGGSEYQEWQQALFCFGHKCLFSVKSDAL
jgi:hypothetical protein